MNRFGDDLSARIDRLVDGCCDADERRATLAQLDAEPDGWRRCALAFLEDQTWREALAPPARSAAVPTPAPVPIAMPALGRSWVQGVPVARWALAASLLAIAFLLGNRLGPPSRSPDDRPATVAPPVTVASLPATAGAGDDFDSEPEDDGATIRAVGWATVEGEGQTARRVPILAGPGLDEEWLQAQPPAVSDYVRSQWESKGYQIAEHRQLMSLNLEDGRRLAIPIGGVELQYVGMATY